MYELLMPLDKIACLVKNTVFLRSLLSFILSFGNESDIVHIHCIRLCVCVGGGGQHGRVLMLYMLK